MDRRLKKIRLDENYPKEVKKHVEWLCNRELAVFMEQGLKRAVYDGIKTLLHRIILELEAKKAHICQYEKELGRLKEAFLKEVHEVSMNLMEWLGSESTGGQTFFPALKGFLSELVKLADLDQFFKVVEALSKSYGLLDPFDGRIEAKAQEMVVNNGCPMIKIGENSDEFKQKLFKKCRKVFSSFGSINICNLLTRTLSEGARSALFNQKIQSSHWFLEAFVNDPTIDHDPALHEKKWVGVPEEIDLQNHPIWTGALGQYDPDRERFKAVKEAYRMVFATELGVFSLRNITFLENYQKAYQRLSKEEKKPPHQQPDRVSGPPAPRSPAHDYS